MPTTITITVKKDGTIETQVSGVAGPTCTNVQALLETLGKTISENPTSDFYRADNQITDVWNQNG